uniref:Uncharacterized protein n=1 Tax=Arundo donax TaxID=35708 RepID=A0A0A8YTH3_ARUDO
MLEPLAHQLGLLRDTHQGRCSDRE